KRQAAMRWITEAAESLGIADLIVVDSLTLTPKRIPLKQFSEMDDIGPTDSGASIPQMIRVAREYIERESSNAKEIWLATDHQASSWDLESTLWENYRELSHDETLPLRIGLLRVPDTAISD